MNIQSASASTSRGAYKPSIRIHSGHSGYAQTGHCSRLDPPCLATYGRPPREYSLILRPAPTASLRPSELTAKWQ